VYKCTSRKFNPVTCHGKASASNSASSEGSHFQLWAWSFRDMFGYRLHRPSTLAMPRQSCSGTITEPHHLVLRNQPLRPDVIHTTLHKCIAIFATEQARKYIDICILTKRLLLRTQ
jgi:hypothetical protein